MKISDLNTKVLLQSCDMMSDGFGGYLSNWRIIEEIWASVSLYKITNQQKNNFSDKVTHKIIIRARTDISNQMRIQYGDIFLEFESVRYADDSQKYQEIHAIKR